MNSCYDFCVSKREKSEAAAKMTDLLLLNE